jgi:hypothetical protein
VRHADARAKCSDDFFRVIVGHLRTVCPVPRGCSLAVHRVDLTPGENGSCSKSGRVFTIEIYAGLSEYETEQVMIHEWAHMLAWRPHHPLSGDHGPDWGVWYSAVYRKYYGVE